MTTTPRVFVAQFFPVFQFTGAADAGVEAIGWVGFLVKLAQRWFGHVFMPYVMLGWVFCTASVVAG